MWPVQLWSEQLVSPGAVPCIGQACLLLETLPSLCTLRSETTSSVLTVVILPGLMLLSGSVLPGVGKGSCAGDAPQHCQGRPGKVKLDFVALEGWLGAQVVFPFILPARGRAGGGVEGVAGQSAHAAGADESHQAFITRTLLGGRGRIHARELSLGLASLGRRL